jgi:hypothetical protein
MGRLTRVLVGLVLSGTVLTGCLVTSTNSGLRKGQPAPEIRGRDGDGEPLLLSDFRGKVVLLEFWASY